MRSFILTVLAGLLCLSPVTVSETSLAVPVGLDVGRDHTCVLLSTGNVECYGNNTRGKAAAYTEGDAIRVSAGIDHTCALTIGGNVHCWANGAVWGRYSRDAVAIDSGGIKTCALLVGGNVRCFDNTGPDTRMDYSGNDAIAVSVGLFPLYSGEVWGWDNRCVVTTGLNALCQTWQAHPEGQGRTIAVSASREITCSLSLEGNVHCSRRGGDVHYNEGDAIGVSAGEAGVCVLREGGDVWCGVHCQCGIPEHIDDEAIDISVGGAHVCVLRMSRDVACYGSGMGHGETQPYGRRLGRASSDNTIHAGGASAVHVRADAEVSTTRLGYVYGDSVTRYTAVAEAATRGDLLPLLKEIRVPPVLARIYGQDGMVRVATDWAPTTPGCWGIQNHNGVFDTPLRVCSQFLP